MNINKIRENLNFERKVLEEKLDALEIISVLKEVSSKRKVSGYNKPVKVTLKGREVFDSIMEKLDTKDRIKGLNTSYRPNGDKVTSTSYYVLINKKTILEIRLDEIDKDDKEYELVITPYKQKRSLMLEQDREWLKLNSDIDNPLLYFSITDGDNNTIFSFLIENYYEIISRLRLIDYKEIFDINELITFIKKDYKLSKSETKIRKRERIFITDPIKDEIEI